MTLHDTKLTATTARNLAKRILNETTFTNVKAKKSMFGGGWEINIDGGRGACYGRTVSYIESAEDIIRIFAK